LNRDKNIFNKLNIFRQISVLNFIIMTRSVKEPYKVTCWALCLRPVT